MIHHKVPVRSVCLASLSACLLAFAGCGGSDDAKEVAPVTGKVTQNGEAVSGGSLTFMPVAEEGKPGGKPASGKVGSDGSYTLTTYGTDDGAVIGKHTVNYSPPADGGSDGSDDASGGHAEDEPEKEYTVEPKEVEVTSGENNIPLEVSVKSGGN